MIFQGEETMKLGAFSVSLNVKDIHRSKEFYENLGFKALGGDINQNWLILKNEDCVIGLFQGMFEKNILTFNPGWNGNAENLEDFTDVRELQKQLKEKGVKIISEADESTEGPAHFTLEDPDGNPILIDQHR
jgi:lactoylglutathione lyase